LHQPSTVFPPPPQTINFKPHSHYKHVSAAILQMVLRHLREPELQALNTVLRRETSTCSWNAAAAAAALILLSPGPSRDNGLGVLIVLQARTLNGCQTRHMNPVTNGNGTETLYRRWRKAWETVGLIAYNNRTERQISGLTQTHLYFSVPSLLPRKGDAQQEVTRTFTPALYSADSHHPRIGLWLSVLQACGCLANDQTRPYPVTSTFILCMTPRLLFVSAISALMSCTLRPEA
jgi:hypothetical protein